MFHVGRDGGSFQKELPADLQRQERQEGSWWQGWGLAPGRATEPLEECGLGTQAARGLGVP